MNAPADLAAWMATHDQKDTALPYVYKYHPRSDIHSVVLCEFIMRDLLDRSEVLREQASRGKAAYGINIRHSWAATAKKKTLDLGVGVPADQAISDLSTLPIRKIKNSRTRAGLNSFSRLLMACEAKAVMTEHGKSQPRLFDELSSSHEIVHQGDPEAIAAGIVMVNIAPTFASPLRQKESKPLHFSIHNQPSVSARMIQHLRGLKIRDEVGHIGFDALCIFVIDTYRH